MPQKGSTYWVLKVIEKFIQTFRLGNLPIVYYLGQFMERKSMIIIENEDLKHKRIFYNNPREWTALIPAAGRGSRLGYSLPKILFPLMVAPFWITWLPIFQAIVLNLSYPFSMEALWNHIWKTYSWSIQNLYSRRALRNGRCYFQSWWKY